MIYLDNNATTKPGPGVIEAMLPYLADFYFNASASIAAFTGVEKPRHDAANAMAKLLNAEEPDCFTFTSGATESNNWVFSSLVRGGARGRVLVSVSEHASIAAPSADLTKVGFEVAQVPIDGDGVVRLDALEDALSQDTLLVSVMAANNETGVLQPLTEIGRLIRARSPKALFHSDATQAVGKIPIDLQGQWHEVDMLSFSAHKFGGPKGIGGLYIRSGVELRPLLLGGGQEEGRRAGTPNTPALAGLAVAATLAATADLSTLAHLRDVFEVDLFRAFARAVIHGVGAPRLPNTCCFSIAGVVATEVADMLATKGIVIGTGSACSSGAAQPPKTLLLMGVPYDLARAALRLSVGPWSGPDDTTALLRELQEAVGAD